MVTHTRNLHSAFNPSKCTHTAVNTHTPWTHTRSSGQPMLRCPWSSWGFGALLKGLTSVVVLKEERALVIHSPHRQSLPDLKFKFYLSHTRLYRDCITSSEMRTWDSNPWPSGLSSALLHLLPITGACATHTSYGIRRNGLHVWQSAEVRKKVFITF